MERNRIFGKPLTLEELLNPAKECEDADMKYVEGDEAAIIAQVRAEAQEEADKAIVIDDDPKDDENNDTCSCAEVIQMCERLKRLCLKYGDLEFPLDLPKQLRLFHR